MHLSFIFITFFIEFGHCLENERPKLQDLLIPKQIQEGELVKLHCDLVKGRQPVQFFWKLDDKLIENGDDFLIINKEEETTLKIKNLSVSHLGLYSCFVQNEAGRDEKQAKLYFNVKPKIVSELADIVAPLNSNVAVNCIANGIPKPLTVWQKLFDNGNVEKEFESETLNFILTKSNSGTYKCLSTSSFGQAERSIAIKYIGKN